MTDLGFANGWKNNPEVVEKCEKAGHKKWRKSVGNCLTECGCEICGYSYKVDSSG